MPTRLQDVEDDRLRQTFPEPDGTAYIRVYNVDPQDLANLPAEGDPMPGEADALLGPFIELNGIKFGKQVEGGKQQVIIKSKLLMERS